MADDGTTLLTLENPCEVVVVTSFSAAGFLPKLKGKDPVKLCAELV